MKVHAISDIHLEMSNYQLSRAALAADVIILAGDIGVGMKGLQWAATQLQSTSAHVIYVAGNHEFYNQDMPTLRAAMRNFCSQDGLERLHYLDNDELILNFSNQRESVRFLGATLWTDFRLFGWSQQPFAEIDGGRCLNDFRLIRAGDCNFTTRASIELHNESVRWLEMKLKQERFGGQTVVVTHHLPSAKSVAQRFAKSMLSACFASNLDHLLGFSDLWIHGHTHDSMDYEVAGTRVICNPRGYCRFEGGEENGDFDPGLIIELSHGSVEVLPTEKYEHHIKGDQGVPQPELTLSARKRDAAIWAIDWLPPFTWEGFEFIDLYRLDQAVLPVVRDIVLTYYAMAKDVPGHKAILPIAVNQIEWLVAEIMKRGPVTKRMPRRMRRNQK